MKVTVGVKAVKEAKPFPKFMKTKIGLEVLMTEDGTGIVTKATALYPLAKTATDWCMEEFTDIESPEVAQPIRPFPKTMTSKNGCLVFFEKPREGMCLMQSGGMTKSGTFAKNWFMEGFTDLELPVTLEND